MNISLKHKLFIADAFTDRPFSGNPAAVCMMSELLTDEQMQNIANEMNLSETAFLYKKKGHKKEGRKPEGCYMLRWFTPVAEVDLCGHATLASAHILWSEQFDHSDELQFETKSGKLTANRDGEWIHLNFPLEVEVSCPAPESLIDGLRTSIKYVGKNRMDYLVEIENEESVRKLNPDFGLLKLLDARGIIVTAKSESPDIDFVSRCFYPAVGVNEDPVTGSAHCCLGPYWQKKLLKTEMTAAQLSPRGGKLKLKLLEDRIILSGKAYTTLKEKC